MRGHRRPYRRFVAAEDSGDHLVWSRSGGGGLCGFLTRVDDPQMHARFWADDLVRLRLHFAAPAGEPAEAGPT